MKAGRIDPKKLQMQMNTDMQKAPPELRKEIEDAQIRIQQTAKKYNGGR